MDLLKLYVRMKVNKFFYQVWPMVPKMIAFIAVVLLIQQKDINLHLNLSNDKHQTTPEPNTVKALFAQNEDTAPPQKHVDVANQKPTYQSAFIHSETVAKTVTVAPKKEKVSQQGNLANTYSNMIYESDKKKTPSNARLRKREKQAAYVKRFYKVAQTEMKKYGIPASITLAQGLIESNAGESRLSRKNNNHFGMKCFSKKCGKGHCSNFTDDSHKDFFRKYKTSWDSYRAHSILLKNKRYRPLFKLDKKDYKSWAHGLKKAGYATDRLYAKKLITLIEDLKLDQFDEL